MQQERARQIENTRDKTRKTETIPEMTQTNGTKRERTRKKQQKSQITRQVKKERNKVQKKHGKNRNNEASQRQTKRN